MKAKILIPYIDKETGQKRKKGDVINITANRFNEISAKGRYIEAVDEPAEPVNTNNKEKTN
jgi:hypothetical protein